MTVPMPGIGPPVPVHFPPITRSVLDNGLSVWSIHRSSAPVAAALLVVNGGSANDPASRPGLAGVTADLLDEGAGTRDAIALADAFARLGTYLEIEVGPDVTTFGLTALSRSFEPALGLLGDIILQPHLQHADFERVRDLRLSRLRQLSRSAGSVADRAFLDAVFSGHPYGHGALGTTPSLQAITLDDVRRFWADSFTPVDATLIVTGDVTHNAVMAAAERTFAGWAGAALRPTAAPATGVVPERRILLVDRPGSPQSELRVGHTGPPRRTPAYHALVTMNAVLGGQFSSRINRTLREDRGVTYGARTAFEFRRAGGNFACETSVRGDATIDSVVEILRQFEAIRAEEPVAEDELERARSSLTRGYVRNFETAIQLARASGQLATHGLPPETFDRFVPLINAVSAADLAAAAQEFVRPADCAVIVVGDAERCRDGLTTLGREVAMVSPEF